MKAQYQPLLRDESSSYKSRIPVILLGLVTCLAAAFIAGYFEDLSVEQPSKSSVEATVGIVESAAEIRVGPSQQYTPEQQEKLKLAEGIKVNSDREPVRHEVPKKNDPVTKQLAMDVCSMSEQNELWLHWLIEYYVQWRVHPLEALNQGHEKILADIKKDFDACVSKESKEPCNFNIERLAIALGVDIQRNGKEDAIKFVIQRAMTKHVSRAADEALDLIVGAGIAESCAWGGKRLSNGARTNVVIRAGEESALLNGGRAAKGALNFDGSGVKTAALVMLEKSPTLAASEMTKKAVTMLANPAIGIAEAVAEVATETVLHSFGIEDPRVIAAATGGVGIFTAMAVGGIIGGPIGVAAGGAIGAASWVVGQLVSAGMRTMHGGDDNWCYAKIGELDNSRGAGGITFRTYAGDDAFEWKEYGTWELASGDADFFSAGQSQDGFFQVKIWDEHGNFVMDFDKIYYRDTFFVSRIEGTLMVVLARGGFAVDSAGKIERFVIHEHK